MAAVRKEQLLGEDQQQISLPVAAAKREELLGEDQ